MKKYLCSLVVIILSLSALCGCEKQPLPVPDYPLDANAIEEALQEWGLSCTLQEDDWVREMRPGQSMYGLYSVENSNFIMAGVSSGEKDGERALFISFPPFYTHTATPAEACESAIVFATRLFGGFESTHQVYDCFIREYGKVNTERTRYEVSVTSSIPMREGDSQWESKIGGITCQIRLEQPMLSEPQEYVRVIVFASDWDTFYGE